MVAELILHRDHANAATKHHPPSTICAWEWKIYDELICIDVKPHNTCAATIGWGSEREDQVEDYKLFELRLVSMAKIRERMVHLRHMLDKAKNERGEIQNRDSMDLLAAERECWPSGAKETVQTTS